MKNEKSRSERSIAMGAGIPTHKADKQHNWTFRIADDAERIERIIFNDVQAQKEKKHCYNKPSARATKSIGSILVKLVNDVQAQTQKDCDQKVGQTKQRDNQDTGEE
jgi:hypothetical protein